MKDYNLCPICDHTPAFCYHLEKAEGGYVNLGITRAEKYAREKEIIIEHIIAETINKLQ